MYTHRKKPSAFTLVEMLIVIVIIGILAAALIPRLTGLQARARDTAREGDLRSIAGAVEVYYIDNGSYPASKYDTIALIPRQIALRDLLIPSVVAQTRGSTLDTLDDGVLSQYLKSLPRDPRGLGVAKAEGSPSCVEIGNSYAYDSDGGSYYAITSRSEAGKGNSVTCGNTIDRDGDGGYKKQGVGLKLDIQANAGGSTTYPDAVQGTDASCFTFSANTITAYDASCAKNIVIPDTLSGITITAIGEEAFRGVGLTSLILAPSIVSIGKNAFRSNLLTSLDLGTTVQNIGYGAFAENQIASIVIPSSVTTIGDHAFRINNLTSLDLGNNVQTIGVAAFRENSLTSIIIPNSITSISNELFYSNQLKSIVIPSSVTTIGDHTFRLNNLTSLDLGTNVQTIGYAAFAENQIESIVIPNSVTTIGDHVFTINKLTSIDIPNSIISIGEYAFHKNGPDKNSRDTIPRSPISDAYGTRNLGGTTWVKQ